MWKTDDIPDKWKDAVNSCKRIHKGFKYMFWTDESMLRFVKRFYPDFYKIFIGYRYNIQRSDVFRYLILYKYGGVYFDLDVGCKQSVNDLLDNDIVLAKSSNGDWSFTNECFMAKPNHPFIKHCIDNLPKYKDSYSFLGKHMHIMNSTASLFLTKMVNNYGKIHNLYVMTKEEYSGDCSVCKQPCNGGTYFTHIDGKSWHSMDSTIFDVFLCNYKRIFGAILIGSGLVLVSR
jgi:mannosyltransferase OCH1-like enzyme